MSYNRNRPWHAGRRGSSDSVNPRARQARDRSIPPRSPRSPWQQQLRFPEQSPSPPPQLLLQNQLSQPQQTQLRRISELLQQFIQAQSPRASQQNAQLALPRQNTPQPRYLYHQLNYIPALALASDWPAHTAPIYTRHRVGLKLYVRVREPDYRLREPDFAAYHRDPNTPLTWARVEGIPPRRNNIVVVVLPLREGKTKFPAFAISLQACRLYQHEIDHFRTETTDTLRPGVVPTIDYIARDSSTQAQWIFAWSEGRRIITTQTVWTSIWNSQRQGLVAIMGYYLRSGVTPPIGLGHSPFQPPVPQGQFQAQQQPAPQAQHQQGLQAQQALQEQVTRIIQSPEVIDILRGLIHPIVTELLRREPASVALAQQPEDQRQTYRERLRKVKQSVLACSLTAN